jgi:hypothetical protein
MRTETGSASIWYASATPPPVGAVQPGTAVTIVVGVPARGSNAVEVQYRINHGNEQVIRAAWFRNDSIAKAQYFRAVIPAAALHAGDTVEYAATCRYAGGEATLPWASFTVNEPANTSAAAPSAPVTPAQAASAPQRLAVPTAAKSPSPATKQATPVITASAAIAAPVTPQAPPQTVTTVAGQPSSISLIPDRFDEKTLAAELLQRLPGFRADGSSAPIPAGTRAVIWVDKGDEVLVHLDSLAVKLLNRNLLVSVDLETDQTGRSPLIVVLSFGADATDPAGLVATTDEYPRGHGQLASRWGRPLQAAVWASIVSLAQDHAAQRSLAPQNIVAAVGVLELHPGPPLRIDTSNTPAKG